MTWLLRGLGIALAYGVLCCIGVTVGNNHPRLAFVCMLVACPAAYVAPRAVRHRVYRRAQQRDMTTSTTSAAPGPR